MKKVKCLCSIINFIQSLKKLLSSISFAIGPSKSNYECEVGNRLNELVMHSSNGFFSGM